MIKPKEKTTINKINAKIKHLSIIFSGVLKNCIYMKNKGIINMVEKKLYWFPLNAWNECFTLTKVCIYTSL